MQTSFCLVTMKLELVINNTTGFCCNIKRVGDFRIGHISVVSVILSVVGLHIILYTMNKYVAIACLLLVVAHLSAAHHELPPECADEPTQTGKCLAHFPRWRFIEGENKCESFVYGGCGATKNIFESKEQCESLCLHEEHP